MINGIIEPIHLRYNNCLEDVLVTYLTDGGYNYKFIYTYKWNFIYFPHRIAYPSSIGSRIDSGWHSNWKAITNLYGFNVITYTNLQQMEFCKLVVYSVKEKMTPIILNIDAYNATWSRAYRKYHMQHYCLIINCDGNYIDIIDPFYSENIINIKISTILIHPYKLLKIDCNNRKEVECSKEQLLQILSDEFMKKQYNGLNALQTIELFAKEFGQYYSYFDDVLSKGKGFSPLCIQIENIAFARMNIISLIRELLSEDNVKGIATRFEYSFSLWKELIHAIRENGSDTSKTKENVCKNLNAIRIVENEIYMHIKNDLM